MPSGIQISVICYNGPPWDNFSKKKNCKNQKHRVFDNKLIKFFAKFKRSKLKNKNLASRNILHVKDIVQWRHPVLKFWWMFPQQCMLVDWGFVPSCWNINQNGKTESYQTCGIFSLYICVKFKFSYSNLNLFAFFVQN